MVSAPVMELQDVDVAYHGDISVLRGLSLQIAEGLITGIIGPNGAGKSTALKTLYGILHPSKGDVLLRGERVNGLAPYEYISRGVAYVPQNRSLFNELSVEDNLRLGCWAFRRDKHRVEEALELAYRHFPMLKERRKDPAGSMSGGQQRFLELGRSLALQPSVLLLDEPTAMIAPRLSREIYDFIKTLPAAGITVVLVDQNIRQCAAVSDHMYVLDLGRVRAEGDRASFGDDSQLRDMISEWLDYQID
ncbi:MAG: ABC transporter ATP-binding protein [Alphaproteobacteria bacterium]|jgi:branched-chain amino acid transport system ATP-binding protein|nr:ABC transporter ATP-binding protein [Alphaproteobacteria bacterium]